MTRITKRFSFSLDPGVTRDLPSHAVVDLLESGVLVKGEFPMLLNDETAVFSGGRIVSLKTFMEVKSELSDRTVDAHLHGETPGGNPKRPRRGRRERDNGGHAGAVPD